MRTHEHELGTIFIPGPDDDLEDLYRLRENAEWFAADTETTGLNHFAEGFRVRLFQCGTKDEAWLLRPEWHWAEIGELATYEQTWYHNWLFDALGLEQAGMDFDEVATQAWCTEILARLIDPRPRMKGGSGHKLEELGEHYLGTDSKKNARSAIHAAWGRKNHVPINECIARCPVDLPEFELYAGQDVFLTARLAEVLNAKLPTSLRRFVNFERRLSRKLARSTQIGMPFDEGFAELAWTQYMHEFQEAEDILANKFKVKLSGTSKHRHTCKPGLIEAFHELGTEWTKTTPTGAVSLDKSVLEDIAHRKDLSGELARTVQRARVNKHYAHYVESMRDAVGSDGRIHPNIRTMEAATARMSMSKPEIHQFPRGDPRPRGCLLADPGEVIISIDLNQIEMRVGAAASQDPEMMRRILSGEDLHAVTATALFGPKYTEDQRQAAKPIGLGWLFLGSATGIRSQMLESDTTGQVPSLAKVKTAIRALDTSYSVYARWAKRLMRMADNDNGKVVTATGRRLFVDRAFASANYYIQSTARDIFADGILRAHKLGLGEFIRIVMHDEIVASVPADEAEEYCRRFEAAMGCDFKGVPITASGKVKGPRWTK